MWSSVNRRESNLLHKELWSEKEKENETKVSEANEKETKVSETNEKEVTKSEAPVDKDEVTWRMRESNTEEARESLVPTKSLGGRYGLVAFCVIVLLFVLWSGRRPSLMNRLCRRHRESEESDLEEVQPLRKNENKGEDVYAISSLYKKRKTITCKYCGDREER